MAPHSCSWIRWLGYGNAYLKALGKQLVRIEDTPVIEAVSMVTPLISHENNWWVRSQAVASMDYFAERDPVLDAILK